MRRVLLLVGCLVLLAGCARANATEVYRCSDANGVSFQDKPCRNGQAQKVVSLPDDPDRPEAPPPAPLDAIATPATEPVAQPPAPIPPPEFFLCTRYDGSIYLSEDGVGSRSAVPLGMLGVPGRSLADAYGGRNGIGVSAPGMRTPPHIPAAQAPFASNYVWMDDACHFANPAEACRYLRGQLETIESRLRRAFSDEEAQLKQDEMSLRNRARGC